jgi:DNA modification methylase
MDRVGATIGELDWLSEKLAIEKEYRYPGFWDNAARTQEREQYRNFLASKKAAPVASGFVVDASSLNPYLFDWQAQVVRWALRKGRAALFEDCGLGKTLQQLEWSFQVCKHTGGNVLILAPLSVADQTRSEADKFGIAAAVCRSQADIVPGINITNYEMLAHFEPDSFVGVVLDESSILKSYDGKTRKQITYAFAKTPYRLACSATPAPNDHMELGTHAEFLGAMTRVEMLSMFFVHDGGNTSKWRLKGHAEKVFWRDFVCSWAVCIRKPGDIGYSDEGYILPELIRHEHVVELSQNIGGLLFTPDRLTLAERRDVRRISIDARVAKCAALVNGSTEQWIVWCDLNDESTALAKAIPDAVEVSGPDTVAHKRQTALDFIAGKIRVVVTKGSIWGFGMNLQNCWNLAKVGLSDSFEKVYQIDRRCWRFGQTHAVNAHLIVSDGDGPVVRNIAAKETEFHKMIEGMVGHMSSEMRKEICGVKAEKDEYRRDVKRGDGWTMHLGDCIEVISEMDPDSIDFSIFSPPFASLYTYSASDRDMGNSRDYGEFTRHLLFLCAELKRVIRPGRLVSIHCMNLPTLKERHGYIGIRDFRGDIIREMERVGFIHHSEVVIWKDPVTAMQRTKAIGLLYKQLRKDSTISRQGIPDYLVTFRDPRANLAPVTKVAPPTGATYKHARNVPENEFPVDLWQNYASPVWMDINPSETLQRESAREDADERHIAPLQLQVIERAIRLWTNRGDVVLSPFGGIGSEGYQALKMDRQFIGIELKESYWKQACANLAAAETAGKEQYGLFDCADETGGRIGSGGTRSGAA